MKSKKYFVMMGLLLVASLALVSAVDKFAPSGNNYQYSAPSFEDYYSSSDVGKYWPLLNDIENNQCTANTDFAVMIPPGGCTPMVVRSDLLAEQNVPVFCQLNAIRINPLIKASAIKSITFKGDYPREVAGISFHPAGAAIRSYNSLVNTPIMNNIGYVVIVLKMNRNETSFPEFIAGNLTATIQYDAERAFGVGKAEFYLPQLSDEDWNNEYKKNSFWFGRGYARVLDVNGDEAKIGLYRDKDDLFNTVTLKKGETSNTVYFPGLYCSAGLKVRLNDVVSQEDKALLNVDGDEIWVRDGSKILNNKCTVRNIKVLAGNTGKLDLSCVGNSKIELSLLDGKTVEISEKSYTVGDFTFNEQIGEVTTDWYVGYVGEEGFGLSEDYVVLLGSDKDIESKTLTDVLESVNLAVSRRSDVYSSSQVFEKEVAKKVPKFSAGSNLIVKQVYEGIKSESFDVKTKEERESKEFDTLNEELIKEYFEDYDEQVNELVSLFPKESNGASTFGEIALWEEAELVRSLSGIIDQSKRVEILEKIIQTYPDSSLVNAAQKELTSSTNYNLENSYASVFVNGDYYSITVKEFDSPDKSEKSVTVLVDGDNKGTFAEGERINFSNTDKEGDYLLVKDIQPKRVTFSFYDYNDGDYKNPTSLLLKLDETKENVGGHRVLISEVDLEEVAFVSLIPEVRNTRSDANFSFKIGVEQRAIDISPEKAEDMIENLNESIEDLEDINEDLEDLITGWKGVCLATSSILNLKNLFFGFDGESIARVEVMKHYKDKCDNEYPDLSRTECYNDLESSINSDVDAYANGIMEVNEEIKEYADRGSVEQTDFEVWREDNAEEKVTIKISEGTEDKEFTFQVSTFSGWEDTRKYLLYESVKDDQTIDEETKQAIYKDMSDFLYPSYRDYRDDLARKNSQGEFESKYGANSLNVISLNEEKRTKLFWNGKTAGEINGLVSDINSAREGTQIRTNTPVQGLELSGATYLLVLSEGFTKKTVKQVYRFNDDSYEFLPNSEKNEKLYDPIFISGGTCATKFVDPKVSYYEISPNINMPAIVPFDLEKGWYVKVPQSSGGILSPNQQGFQASGAVSFFYICNVGPDGRESNTGGDDICQSFNVNNLDKVDSFGLCSLDSGEVRNLIRDAQRAVQDAQRGHGDNPVSILGKPIPTGAPLNGENQQFECQDFMSPSDCKLMFNACDPVICPSSRCDFGGTYPVSNVVASGIVGSSLLCLPNWQEGVVVPVCLTGIHAGLDAYTKILKAEQKCLQEGIETGGHTGICDEMTAVYECEFFWRQAQPLLNTLVPRVLEGFYTGSFRTGSGGGEYLTFQSAWDNAQKSVEFFKDQYANTAFKAVRYGDVQEIGGEFCNAFIGTSLPTSAEAIDSLLEPESPVQFYAQFSEIPFTEATVPATSQYKVFYNIYAGRQQGVHYNIYIKNPPSSSYYQNNPRVGVRSGFIPAGDSEDESIDFTAPAGYKELCVVINGQEECGFKQVSSSFAANYLHDAYLEEQAGQKDITTEKECISGSPSVLGLASTNIQSGFEEAIDPSVDLRGLIRVCATSNPGEGVNNDRWELVGHCGNPNLRCWLDTKSVDSDTLNLANGTGTLKEAEEIISGINENSKMLLDESDSDLQRLRAEIDKIDIDKDDLESEITKKVSKTIFGLDKVISIGNLNVQQAEAISLKGRLFKKIIEGLFDQEKTLVVKPGSGLTITGDESSSEENTVSSESSQVFVWGENKNYYEEFIDTEIRNVVITSDNRILYGDQDFGLILVDKGNKNYLVKKGFWRLGTSMNGRIDIRENHLILRSWIDVDAVNYVEKNYVFDGSNFVKKTLLKSLKKLT